QVDAVIAVVAARDLLARRVEVDVASHHAIVDPILADLRAELAGLDPQPPAIPVFVTTGDSGSDSSVGAFDADHWVANLRNPVMFADAVAAAGAEHTMFVEVSPNPVVTYAVDDTLADSHHHTLGTLARDADDTLSFHTNLNATHTARPPVTPHGPEPHVPIPTAPWHHTRHWIAPPPRRGTGASAPASGTLLGARTPLAGAMAGHLWQAELLPQAKPYPGSRRIAGVEIVPPSVLIRTLVAAAAEAGAGGLEDVRFDSPVTVDQPRLVQVFTDGATITISSAATSESEPHWIRNATARVAGRPAGEAAEPDSGADHALDPSAVEQFHSTWGIEGQTFEWSVDAHEAMPGRLRTDIALQQDSPAPAIAALLDAAMDLSRLAGTSEDGLMLPVAVDAVAVSPTVPDEHRGVIDVRRRAGADGELVVDVSVHGADRQSCAELRGLRFKSVQSSAALAPAADPRTVAHTIDWQPWERDTAPAVPAPVVVIGDNDAAHAIRDSLAGLGHPAADLLDARYVLYVADPATSGTDVDAAAGLVCDAGEIVARLAERDARNPATLWILTRGVYEAGTSAALRQSCLWALGGVIGAEQPQLWGGLVDIDPDVDAADCVATLSAILHTPAKGTLLLRDGALLKSALAPLPRTAVRQPLRCRPDAAYLVTGGLGDLGLLTAGWLAERGARHLVLLGRTKLDLEDGGREGGDADGGSETDAATRRRVAAIRALERGGVTVQTAAIDIGSPGELQALLERREAEAAPPIRGVVHAAGVTEGQLLTDLDPDRVRRTVWPKIAGAQVLHDAFPPGRLDFLYFIASAGSVFGVPGQAAYASGNAYLDALARSRRSLGDDTISLDWVAWEGLGLGKDAQIVVDELERVGSRPINPAEAAAAWEYVTRFDSGQVVMAPLLAGAADVTAHQADLPTVDWSHLSPEELRAELQKGVRSILAAELRISEDQLDLDLPFAEMGLNSVMAISIRRQLEQFVGIELSATMLFNHPTIAGFAGYLANRVMPEAATEGDETVEDSAGSVLDSLFDTVEATS
ncbi:MAG: KR domain-containing protein, partial [Mycobacterium sp.]